MVTEHIITHRFAGSDGIVQVLDTVVWLSTSQHSGTIGHDVLNALVSLCVGV